MLFSTRPMYDVEGNGGGGNSPPPPPPPPAPPANNVTIDKDLIAKLTAANPGINLDSPVVMDGKSYTINDLIKAKKENETLAVRAGKADEYEKTIKDIYAKPKEGEQANLEAARTALSDALKTAGWGDEEIKAELDATYPTGDPTSTAPTEDLKDKMMRDILVEKIETAAFGPFSQHPLITAILKGRHERDVESIADPTEKAAALKDHEQFVQEWKDQAFVLLKAQLNARKEREKTFSIAWIGEEAKKVAETIAAKLRRAAGDPKYLGKSPATAAERNPFSNLDAKPVAAPKAERGKTTAAGLDKSFEAYAVDRLSRVAAGVLETSGAI